MTKKSWNSPTLNVLSVQATAFGTTITSHVDDSVKVGKFTFFSFS